MHYGLITIFISLYMQLHCYLILDILQLLHCNACCIVLFKMSNEKQHNGMGQNNKNQGQTKKLKNWENVTRNLGQSPTLPPNSKTFICCLCIVFRQCLFIFKNTNMHISVFVVDLSTFGIR